MRYSDLPTERANPRSRGLDLLPTPDLVRVIHDEDRLVPDVVERVLPEIARLADYAAAALGGEGRLVYIGAGTSGRLGVLDAAECPPTFGTEPGRVVAILAGGPEAVFRSAEGAEDDGAAGEKAVESLCPGPRDVVIAIAASGTTPFSRGGLAAARRAGARTGLITAANAPADVADVVVRIETGPEVIAGSTRMKAGTATKLVLNMISTAAMVRIGKVHDNLMVDLRATSAKLRDRAVRMVVHLTGLDPDAALGALDGAGGEVKTAVVAARLSLTAAAARERLAAAGGRLRGALGAVGAVEEGERKVGP